MSIPDTNSVMAQASFSPATRAHLLPNANTVTPDSHSLMAKANYSPAAQAHLLPGSNTVIPDLIRDPLAKAKATAIRIGIASCLCLLLSACGFQLRESAQLPPEMQNTQILIGDEYSQLARRVRIHLEQAGVSLVKKDRATAILEIPKNEVLTEVLSIGDNARVREYRITHTVQFRLTDMQGKDIVPLQTIRQSRDISFDEQQILAVSREQEYVKDDLANTLSRLLISRLEIVGSQ